MEYCTHCGEPLKENADFCLACGKLVTDQPKQTITRYQTISKTTIAIIGFFALIFIFNIFSIPVNSGYHISTYMRFGILIPAILILIFAALIGVIALIENNKKQLSKEVFIIGLMISGFFVLTSIMTIFEYITIWRDFL